VVRRAAHHEILEEAAAIKGPYRDDVAPARRCAPIPRLNAGHVVRYANAKCWWYGNSLSRLASFRSPDHDRLDVATDNPDVAQRAVVELTERFDRSLRSRYAAKRGRPFRPSGSFRFGRLGIEACATEDEIWSFSFSIRPGVASNAVGASAGDGGLLPPTSDALALLGAIAVGA